MQRTSPAPAGFCALGHLLQPLGDVGLPTKGHHRRRFLNRPGPQGAPDGRGGNESLERSAVDRCCTPLSARAVPGNPVSLPQHLIHHSDQGSQAGFKESSQHENQTLIILPAD